jgi:acetyltransferase
MACYPAWLETSEHLADGTSLLIRPIKPEDWPLLQPGLMALTPEDRHFRFMGGLDTISDEQARRLATVDYEREIAIVAVAGKGQPAGLVRVVPFGADSAELAVLTLPRWRGHGLGRLLCERALLWARRQGLNKIEIILQAENRGMRQLAERLGFRLRPMPDEFGVLQGVLELT